MPKRRARATQRWPARRQRWCGPHDASLSFMGDSVAHTEALHVIERYTRVDYDTITYEVTIDDPKAFTKTWSPPATFLSLRPGERLHEYECIENNEDIVRFEQLLKNESLFRRQP